MQDATKVVMGVPMMSGAEVSDHDADPASFPAGTAVRLKSDGTISKILADGGWLGVSLGKSLSDSKKLSICRSGLRVPILMSKGPARGIVTITSYANLVLAGDDTLKVGATTFTFKASASAEDEVTAATDNATTAANLVSKINAHSVAGLLFIASRVGAVVTITAIDNSTEGADVDLIYTDEGTATVGLTVDDVTFTGGGISPDYATIGAKAYFSDVTGLGDDANSDSTISDASFVSSLLTGIDESGAEVDAALVDMPGGL